MITELMVWLAALTLRHEIAVLTVIFAVCLGYELAGHGPQHRRLPLRRSMWQALRTTGAVGALAIVAAHLIVGTACSLIAGQGIDLLIVVAAGMATGAAWRRLRIRKQPHTGTIRASSV